MPSRQDEAVTHMPAASPTPTHLGGCLCRAQLQQQQLHPFTNCVQGEIGVGGPW